MPRDDKFDKYTERSDRDFKELNYGTRHSYWYAVTWITASTVAIFAIGVLLWGLGVFSAGPKGAGDAYKENQSGQNRVEKQEMFEDLYQDIQAADKGVHGAALAKADDPSFVTRTNYIGAVNYCNGLVAKYDAEARKYTSADWRDNVLPEKIDQSKSEFDCKENVE